MSFSSNPDDAPTEPESAPADPPPRLNIPGAPRPELAAASTAEIFAELERRQRRVAELNSRRDVLRRELAEIDLRLARVAETPLSSGVATAASPPRTVRMITSPAPRPQGGGRRRVHNDLSLPEALAAAVEPNSTVSPAQAAQLVRKHGYISNARSFPMMVSHVLATDARFRRVARGSYLRLPDRN